MQIGANYKAHAQAFYDADAGVNYVIAKMEAGLKASPATFTLPTVIGDPTDPSDPDSVSLAAFTTPSGFGFSFKDPGLTMIAANLFTFTSEGSASNNAQSVIRVTIERGSAITLAAFGDEKMEMHNSAQVYSYDSSTSAPATGIGDSSHQGDIGSNEWVVTKNSSVIDGDGVFGEYADGSATTDDIWSVGDFTGDAPSNAGRIDPDPLGINSGGEYDPTTYATAPPNNDNDKAVDSLGNDLTSNVILLKSGGGSPSSIILYGKPGGANYYVTDIDLKNGYSVTIDTRPTGPYGGGPVNLFLDSPSTAAFDMHNGSAFNVLPATGDVPPANTNADEFAFFTNYTGKLDVKHSAAFNGLFYAPLAEVVIHNCGDINGAVWGRQVDIKNSGVINYNTALADKYLSNELTKTTWRDNRS